MAKERVRRKKSGGGGWIAAVIVILCAAGAGGYFYLQNQNETVKERPVQSHEGSAKDDPSEETVAQTEPVPVQPPAEFEKPVVPVVVKTVEKEKPAPLKNPTVLTLTDEVLRKDIRRFGINLGGDAWYSGSALTKERMPHGGFEGIIYRGCSFGPGGDETSFFDWWKPYAWDRIIKGADYMLLSGPKKGTRGKVTDITSEVFDKRPDKKDPLTRYHLSNGGPGFVDGAGILFTREESDNGFLGQHGGSFWVFTKNGSTVKTETGDVRPGSIGKIAAVLTAPGDAVAELMAPHGGKKWMKLDGTWRLKLWAKGTGTFVVSLGDWGHRGKSGVNPQNVTLTPEWKSHELVFEIADWKYDSFCTTFYFTGGTCKLDELSFKQDGDKNPTAFRDPVVDVLKKYKAGSIRHLQIGGSTFENHLRPREARMAFQKRGGTPPKDNNWPSHPEQNGGASYHPYGFHEFMELCKEVGADPWYCTPGVIYYEEMNDLMEYLGGPVTTKFGKIRADRGQEKPWTEVFKTIHIEFGNEAWNNAGAYRFGGFNGSDYWHDLIVEGKKSPYYKKNIKFQLGGQAVSSGRNAGIARDKENADGFGVAPYIIHSMSRTEAQWNSEQIWSWVFGYPWHNAYNGYMASNMKDVTEKHGLELSIYEVNHHITGGDAPQAARNKIVASIGGGLNVANWMLLMIKEQNVRVQNLFSLLQFAYKTRKGGKVRLWGTVLTMKRGEEKYRPTFLACMLANQVLEGDLVKVDVSGENPKWTCSGKYSRDGNPAFQIPYLQAYSTKNGKSRGLVVFNLHRSEELEIKLALPGGVAKENGRIWRLEADDIHADNEPEHEPRVKVTEAQMPELSDGMVLKLKPFSMTVIRFEEQN